MTGPGGSPDFLDKGEYNLHDVRELGVDSREKGS